MINLTSAVSPKRTISSVKTADLRAVFRPDTLLKSKLLSAIYQYLNIGEIVMNQGWVRCLGLSVFCLLLTGCVTESMSDDGGFTCGYAWWVSVVSLLGGLALMAGGWALRENHYGWLLMAGGVFAFVIWGPASFTEHFTINDTGFRCASGIWGMTKNEVKYEDMSLVTYSKEQKSGRRGRKYDVYYITVNRKTGDPIQMKVDNLLEHAGMPLLISAQMNGVSFQDLTGELPDARLDNVLDRIKNENP